MNREERVSKFLSMCTTLPFEEKRDERDTDSVPELMNVAEMRDAGNVQAAIDYASSLLKMYPDNDLIPFMMAYIYYQKDFPKEALQTAIAAIPKCPRKYRLYSVAGLAEFEQGHLPEALVWWCRSVIAQCTIEDFGDHDPFVHLAHAAETIGASRQAEMLFTMTDAIDEAKSRLDAESLQKLMQLKGSWAQEPLLRVLQHIESKYLHG